MPGYDRRCPVAPLAFLWRFYGGFQSLVLFLEVLDDTLFWKFVGGFQLGWRMVTMEPPSVTLISYLGRPCSLLLSSCSPPPLISCSSVPKSNRVHLLQSNFSVAHKYTEIKSQKISPEGKSKIQLQIVLHDGNR